MSNVVFLKTEWSELHYAVTKAESLAELDALFASLQHRAFRGELS